jgi:hypothetical protein
MLNRLFDEGLTAAVAAGPGGAKAVLGGQRAQRAAEAALLELPEGRALLAQAEQHIAAYGMPTSEEVLARLMALDKALLALAALEALTQQLEAGTLKRHKALKARLNALVMTSDLPKVVAAASRLLGALPASH